MAEPVAVRARPGPAEAGQRGKGVGRSGEPTESEFRILGTSPISTLRPSRTPSPSLHHPKIEAYDGYLYLILHGIDYQKSRDEESFITHDTDFFLGANYLVTIHDGKGRSVNGIQDVCGRTTTCSAKAPAR